MGITMRIMLAIVIALTCGLSTGLAQQNQVLVAEHVKTAEKNLTYKEAYRRAQTGDKPLLVLVTALPNSTMIWKRNWRAS